MSRYSHAIRLRLAILLAAIPFHRVTIANAGEDLELNKRRRPSSFLLIPLANAYLRWMGSRSLMLSNHQWRRWEAAIGAANVSDDQIATPKYPGQTLRNQLSDDRLGIDAKMHCFQLALEALSRLHQTEITWEERTILLSHGDATAGNVCIDPETSSASWFDFDTRHRLELPATQRHADDLRALLYSSAACLQEEDYDHLLSRGMRARTETLMALQQLLSQWSRPDTFQLAQAPMDYDSHERFTRRLRDIVAVHDVAGHHRQSVRG